MSSHEAINNVRRKINEVLKKTDEKIVVGWRPHSPETYKEGDVWTDSNDKTWTIKNGIKQTVTKLDSAKTPWFCPVCEKAMSHRLDTKYWTLRGKCMDCVIRDETEMRRLGLWAEYEKRKVKENYIAFLKDKIQELTHIYENISAPEMIYADSEKILMMEKWNVDLNKIKADMLNDISQLTDLLKKAESGELDESDENIN